MNTLIEGTALFNTVLDPKCRSLEDLFPAFAPCSGVFFLPAAPGCSLGRQTDRNDGDRAGAVAVAGDDGGDTVALVDVIIIIDMIMIHIYCSHVLIHWVKTQYLYKNHVV